MARRNQATVSPEGESQVVARKKPFYKRVWFWLLVILVIIIAIAVSGDDEDESAEATAEDQEVDQEADEEDDEEDEEDSSSEETEEDGSEESDDESAAEEEADGGETFSVGDEFEVNDWLVTVTNVGERTTTIGDEFLNTEAQGEFLPIDLEVMNDGDSSEYFFASDFVAVDDQDREYSYSSDATIYGASEGAVSLLDEINPGNSIDGTLSFDVPEDAEIVGLDIDAGFLSDPVRVSLD